MAASGSRKAILAALTANAGIAVAKFLGFLVTQSSAMLAEAPVPSEAPPRSFTTTLAPRLAKSSA